MKLIIGLGNAGEAYRYTRHNIGFRIINQLAGDAGLPEAKLNDKFKACITEGTLVGQKVILAKPTTMMNLSGQAVQLLVQFYKIDPSDVWVVYDEADLGFGKLRVRQGGASAGHNGIKSVIEVLGENFGRFRFGVRNEHFVVQPTDAFVLSKFTANEAEQLPAMIESAAHQVLSHLETGELVDTTYDILAK
ncbi:MAG TPA: aminoacyl-tRNA hydrolase [Candidatus Nanoarchaeia archaeon]|nr:aminoacyl-tRNA hydrolase [Candidatus Nanoarchaeia archaeon]